MTNTILKQAADCFYEKISQKKYAEATLRNYRQKIHALLRFCDSMGFESFNYEEAETYSQWLNERVERGEIQNKYAGFLKSIALSFADFNSVPSDMQDDYTFVPHKTFVSSKNTLNADSRNVYEEFHHYLSDIYAPASFRGFLVIVSPLLHYLEDNSIPLNEITPQIIREYLVFIAPNRPNSMGDVVLGIRVFLRFLSERGYISWSVDMMSFRMAPSRKKVPVAYSDSEIQRMVESIDTTHDTGKRDYAIIVMSLFTGLRSVDIRNLKLSDIDWEKDLIHIIQHKTNRELIIPLLTAVGNATVDYILNGRPESKEPYVFLSHGRGSRGEPMGAGTIINRMRIYLKKSGIKKSGFDGKDFHALRKTFATNLLVSGTPLESVASALGDAGVQAAKPYLALDDDNLRLCCPEKMAHPCRKEGLDA